MNGLTFAVTLMAAFPAPPQDPQANSIVPEERRQAQADLAKLQGTWVRVSMEVQGRQSSLEGAEWTATYEGDRLTLKTNGKHDRRGIVTLDLSRTPKAMNTWDADGPNNDKSFPGIYEVDGDTLRVCFARPGEERPAAFSTTPGTGFLDYVYKRKKP